MNKLQVVFADLWSSLHVCEDINFSSKFLSKESFKMKIFLTIVHIFCVPVARRIRVAYTEIICLS